MDTTQAGARSGALSDVLSEQSSTRNVTNISEELYRGSNKISYVRDLLPKRPSDLAGAINN